MWEVLSWSNLQRKVCEEVNNSGKPKQICGQLPKPTGKDNSKLLAVPAELGWITFTALERIFELARGISWRLASAVNGTYRCKRSMVF